MNKISIYALTFFLSLSSVTVYSQKNNKQVIFTNEQGSDIFYHTIERGQTVYAIATMYGVSVEDIYRLNPESKEGIKAGSTLRIPQKDLPAKQITIHTIRSSRKRPCTLYPLNIQCPPRILSPPIRVSPHRPLRLARISGSRRHDWKPCLLRKKRPYRRKWNIPYRKKRPCTISAGSSIFPARSF